jgi:hypothetical protein
VGHVEELIFKASAEQVYTLRSIQGVKSKRAKSEIPVIGGTYSCSCVCSRLYQSRQTTHLFLKGGGNDVLAQGKKMTLMKGNMNIEQRGLPGNTLAIKNDS